MGYPALDAQASVGDLPQIGIEQCEYTLEGVPLAPGGLLQ
jgi:hypothetical protein